MIISLRLVLIFCSFFAVFTIAKAGAFQLNEHGTRAMGQAGAFAARAYDPSAVYFNPAGLAFQKNNALYFGSVFIAPDIDFYGPTHISEGKKTSMNSQVFTPINAYGKYGINDDLHFGFGIYNAFGLGSAWPETWDGRAINIKADLQTFFFTPTLAYKINDQLSVGGGINIITGNVTLVQSRNLPFADTSNNPRSTKVTLELSGMSFGFNLGALYKFDEILSLGISYRSGSSIEGKGTATFSPSYQQVTLPDGKPAFGQGNANGSLDLPSTAYFGIAMKPMEHLEVEVDYQFVGWSSFKELKINFEANGTSEIQPKNYEDTYIFRMGGEYSIDDLKIRFGYLFDNSPVQEKYVDPILPDADRYGWNLGLGYQISENISIDAAYLFIKVKQNKVTNTITSFDGTYNSIAHLLSMNIGYSF